MDVASSEPVEHDKMDVGDHRKMDVTTIQAVNTAKWMS
jgi:hypothetical protein